MRVTTTMSPKLGGGIFTVIGLVMLGVAFWLGGKRVEILNSWPVVNAEVVTSELTHRRDSDGDSTYGAEIEFRFRYEGREYTAHADRGYTTSSRSSMRRVVEKFAPGTQHPIHVNPQDPPDVRFNAGYSLEFFGIPLFVGLFGLVFSGIGIAVMRSKPSPYASAAGVTQPGTCPTCGTVSSISQKFCPKCGTMLHDN